MIWHDIFTLKLVLAIEEYDGLVFKKYWIEDLQENPPNSIYCLLN